MKAKPVDIQEVLQYNPRFVAPCNPAKVGSKTEPQPVISKTEPQSVILKVESHTVVSKTENQTVISKTGRSQAVVSKTGGSQVITSKVESDNVRDSKPNVIVHPRSRQSISCQKVPVKNQQPLVNPARRRLLFEISMFVSRLLGKTMVVVGESERNRLDRRVKQAGMKRTWEDMKGLKSENPNREFSKMIADYRTGLDIRLLQVTDSIFDGRICVCIRKRPLSQKEKMQGDVEVLVVLLLLFTCLFRSSRFQTKIGFMCINQKSKLT